MRLNGWLFRDIHLPLVMRSFQCQNGNMTSCNLITNTMVHFPTWSVYHIQSVLAIGFWFRMCPETFLILCCLHSCGMILANSEPILQKASIDPKTIQVSCHCLLGVIFQEMPSLSAEVTVYVVVSFIITSITQLVLSCDKAFSCPMHWFSPGQIWCDYTGLDDKQETTATVCWKKRQV
jgi:hypothetical protein